MKHIITLRNAICTCCIALLLPTTASAEDSNTHIFFFKDGHIVYGIAPEQVGRMKLSSDKSSLSLRDMSDAELRSWSITDLDSISTAAREYAVSSTDWVVSGTSYNGFKGTCPVFSPDGRTVYINTFNKISSLYAFDIASGAEKWHYTPAKNAGSYNMATVNPQTGDIYYGTTTAGQFYCITADGELRWTYTAAASMQAAAPAVSADGKTVFIADKNGRTAAIDATSGAEKWNTALGSAGCGILVNGDEIVVGTAASVTFLSASTGETVKTLPFTSSAQGMSDISGFAVAADKATVYVPQLAGYMSSFSLTTREWLVQDLQVAGNNLYEPAVAPNGNVFVGSKDSKMYIVKGDLSEVVKVVPSQVSANNAFNYSHPVATADNKFLITAGQVLNVTYVVSEEGVLQTWSDGESANQKQMGGNNLIDGVLFSAYIGAAGDNGALVGRYVGSERASGWSSHGGDICGSCCVK